MSPEGKMLNILLCTTTSKQETDSTVYTPMTQKMIEYLAAELFIVESPIQRANKLNRCI